MNDVMSYIVTNGNDETKSLPAPKRSYTPQDVLKKDSGLSPDIEYYLYKQIFPPIERLCAPLPGTDSVQLAECLGLDTRKYQINSSSSSQQQHEIPPLESQIPDSIRFRDAVRLNLRCRSCRELSVFEGLCESSTMCSPNGIACSNAECGKPFARINLVAQLEAQIRAQTFKYYESWLRCDDESCGNRTRSMSVYGHRCLGPAGKAEGCTGKMSYEYSNKALSNQLSYFASLWDVEKAKTKAKNEKEFSEVRDRVMVLAETNKDLFTSLKTVVDGYEKKCGDKWVDMAALYPDSLKKQTSAAP
jgi:DNA polymerase alpha subunit A